MSETVADEHDLGCLLSSRQALPTFATYSAISCFDRDVKKIAPSSPRPVSAEQVNRFALAIPGTACAGTTCGWPPEGALRRHRPHQLPGLGCWQGRKTTVCRRFRSARAVRCKFAHVWALYRQIGAARSREHARATLLKQPDGETNGLGRISTNSSHRRSTGVFSCPVWATQPRPKTP